ncbi:hypothetical protein BC829DRAFT_442419 [Chytridium lagenaria]|nr:hypothetical protein BC829DRAFT_442419 [Chytridium lagenaria]
MAVLQANRIDAAYRFTSKKILVDDVCLGKVLSVRDSTKTFSEITTHNDYATTFSDSTALSVSQPRPANVLK